MSEFRTDPLFGSLCLVAAERAARPRRIRTRDELQITGPCPLCPGNEALCPPEITRGELQQNGRWQVRVFPNRYPTLNLEAHLPEVNPRELKPYQTATGFGVHEVIAESPSHTLPFWSLDTEESVEVFRVLQRRTRDLYKDQRIRYVQLFKNHGAGAGGSLDHPHFQLVGMPFNPTPVDQLFRGRGCKVCELLKHDHPDTSDGKPPGERVMAESSRFVALADFAPQYAYQFSIYPKRHQSGFELAGAEDLEDLSQLLSQVLPRMERLLGDLALNLVFYNRPNPAHHTVDESMHWFLRVFPRQGRVAGFEVSTGISLVHVAPEDAARAFREKGV